MRKSHNRGRMAPGAHRAAATPTVTRDDLRTPYVWRDGDDEAREAEVQERLAAIRAKLAEPEDGA